MDRPLVDLTDTSAKKIVYKVRDRPNCTCLETDNILNKEWEVRRKMDNWDFKVERGVMIFFQM